MPQVPIIIPVIITGIVLGSIIKNQKSRITKKKFGGAALVSGLLNAAYAYTDYLLTPQQATFRRVHNSEDDRVGVWLRDRIISRGIPDSGRSNRGRVALCATPKN